MDEYDVVVVGGGPAGATAATDLAGRGRSVLLLDKGGRIKPCGGAIPPRALDEFDIPSSVLLARISGADIVSPRARRIGMPIEGGGYVGMVDRASFDPWLCARAAMRGATTRRGEFRRVEREGGATRVHYTSEDGAQSVRTRAVIGADGALSPVGRAEVPGADRHRYVFAYHEIVEAPALRTGTFYDERRCDVYYDGALSPDFYSWIFPHGDTASIGTGSACKGFSLKGAVAALRTRTGLETARTLRREGAPIPLRPLDRWDNGADVVLAGDAAGVVAPASGEGIYYAMLGGRLAGEAADEMLRTGDARALAHARRRFMRAHGQVFWMLGMMQKFWYSNDGRRERFVSICRDRDVQSLTWEAYMNKALVRAKPAAHARIFFKNIAHLTGLAPA